jgi:hypothetical protein
MFDCIFCFLSVLVTLNTFGILAALLICPVNTFSGLPRSTYSNVLLLRLMSLFNMSSLVIVFLFSEMLLSTKELHPGVSIF